MPKKDGKVHLFLAETTEREKDLLSDILLYNKLFNVNVLQDYNLVFKCYQTVYKYIDYEFGLVIADEIHNSLTEEYSKFYFNNSYDAIVGLSATVDKNFVIKYENGIKFTKGDLLKKIAPVVYKYSFTEALGDNISRNLNIFVISQDLDSVNKNIKAGNAKKVFFQTEKTSYEYWNKEHKKSWFIEDLETKDLKIRITAMKRSKLLFSLPSKIKTTKNVLDVLKGKSIIFGNSLDSLLEVTKNVVSSRNSELDNKKIRDDFDNNKINIIGSFKKLRQGANLKDLDNVILMSYYSSELHIIQQIGRIRDIKLNNIGNVIIILTKNTQAEIWFQKMTENLQNVNYIYCDNLKEFKQKYEESNK
jgi:superfamily II DNA or RNA helicase